MGETQEKLAYTAKELAGLLGVSKTQVLDWAHRGIIPAKQPAGKGGRVIFPKKLVDKWLEELETDVKPRLRLAR
ncbi:MAG: helix-turn-helix domain-containing protein [Moorellaceae bacterium]